jgi:autotransporter-associated beta strand protein
MIAFTHREAGGGSVIDARFRSPLMVAGAIPEAIVNPADPAQSGIWLTNFIANNALVKNGTGTVTLNGNNTFNGTTTVNGGTLIAANNNSLGTTAAGTTVNSGATLGLTGGITLAGETLTINGLGSAGQLGALVNISGDNIIAATSPITARAVNAGEIRFASLAGTFTVDAAINLNTSKLSVDGSGNTIVNGVISGTGKTVAAVSATSVFGDVAEANGYTLAVEHNNIPISVNGTLAFPYTADNTSLIGAFDRIAYYLELQGGAEAPTREFVYVSMDAFTNNIGRIGVPTGATKWAFQQFVTNMNVVSNVPTGTGGGQIVQGTNIATGNIEIWPSNYGQGNSFGVPNASSAATNAGFDFGDGGFNTTDGHGSFQIHNYDVDGAGPGTIGQTILAYNQWRQANGGLGIGNSPAAAASGSDYTSSVVSPSWCAKLLPLPITA